MAQTQTGLNNNYGLGNGITTHYTISYDTTLSQADGKTRANALIGACEGDYTWMSNLFGGTGIPFSLPVSVQLVPGAYAGAGWGPPITVTPGNGQPIDLVRYLLVSEVVEMMMDQRANGWGYSFGDGNEGSKGEALSRFLGFQFLSQNGLNTGVLTSGGSTFFVANDWLNSTRTDFVNNNPDDNHPDATTGCTTLFVYYLFTQLQFTIPQIINAGSRFLSGVYTTLTGDPGDPFPFFKRLLDNAFPGTSTINAGPNFDNPFPLGLLSFWVDQNTFGRDQVQDIINHQGGLVSNAFWLVLEGFSINSFNALNISIPALTGAFRGLAGITVSATPATPGGPTPAAPIPVFEDPTNLTAPQRIRFSFDIKFSNLNAFPAMGSGPATAELDATANVGGNQLPGASASTLFELLAGANPYFTNVDPNNQGDVFYLSQDLRVFSVTAGSSPVPGAPAFTTDPYASIQSLIGFLNGNSTYANLPGATDPLNALPGQSGYETADSSVFATDTQGHHRYNFALARVRMRGAGGSQALNARVFFRLWVAQSFDTDFQPATTYKSTLGTSGPDNNNPVFPLASGSGLTDPSGQSVQTIPFFATDAAGSHDYDGTVTNSNIQNITIPSTGDSVCAYFGCFLDVFDSSNNSKFGGTHHCIVAQIAYDGAPIPTSTPSGTTPTPANWDQLSQRNLQITSSENPQSPATHVIPQAFDTRPSLPLITPPGLPVSLPDEIMIDWGNTPSGSTASIYWPQLNAADVIALANQSYSSHLLSAADANTLQCTVTKGVTYIPIPPASSGNFAGLLTLDLPTTITKGQEFNVVIRRVSTRTPPPPPPPIQIEAKPQGQRNAVSVATKKSASQRATRLVAERRRSGKGRGIRQARTADSDTGKIIKATADEPVVTQSWRQISGAFQVRIPVLTKETMLPMEEDTLAVLKWRLQQMSPVYRWYPVLQRYVSLIAARVDGLGGNSQQVPPSLGGYAGKGKHGGPEPSGKIRECHTGKVAAICYDCYGDFEGFVLQSECCEELRFYGHEPRVEQLVRLAWEERWLITVEVDRHEPHCPRAIILRRPAHNFRE